MSELLRPVLARAREAAVADAREEAVSTAIATVTAQLAVHKGKHSTFCSALPPLQESQY